MSRLSLTGGIAFRFMSYLVIFSILITITVTAMELWVDYNKRLKLITEELHQIEGSYVSSLSRAVWDLDEEQIETQINGILNLPNVVFVEIRTKHERIKRGDKPPASVQKVEMFDLVFKRDSQQDAGLPLGKLHVVASLQPLYERMNDRGVTIFITEGFKTFLLTIFVLFIFHFLITRHLIGMSAYARTFNVNTLDSELKIRKIRLLESQNDELGQVASAINEMRTTLRDELRERRRAEEAYASQWELLNNILSNIPSSIFWKNQELQYVGCNKNFASDAALESTDDVISKYDRDLPWTESEVHHFEEVDNKVVQEGRSFINQEEVLSKSNGEKMSVLMSKVPLSRKSGEVIGILGVYTDITTLKHAEQQVREMNENLEQMVRARTKQLEESNHELSETLLQLQSAQDQLVESEKMAALGSLVAGIAHEVNTPVGIGVTAASYLKENSDKITEKLESKTLKRTDFEDYIKSSVDSAGIILKNLERAAELIRGFKQVAVDQSSDQNREFNVDTYVHEILISLRPKLKNRKVKVEVNCDPDITIYSSPGAFSHVLTNLVTNALVHAFEENDEGSININGSLNEDGELVIVFADTGKGIPAESLKNIYDPFYTTKRGQGGSGLGLHILYNTVTQSLGGRVNCESELGKGTCFTLTIPVKLTEKK